MRAVEVGGVVHAVYRVFTDRGVTLRCEQLEFSASLYRRGARPVHKWGTAPYVDRPVDCMACISAMRKG